MRRIKLYESPKYGKTKGKDGTWKILGNTDKWFMFGLMNSHGRQPIHMNIEFGKRKGNPLKECLSGYDCFYLAKS